MSRSLGFKSVLLAAIAVSGVALAQQQPPRAPVPATPTPPAAGMPAMPCMPGMACPQGVPGMPQAQRAKTDAELITNAMSAAPDAIGRDAAIMVPDDKGNMRTLRAGKNNFTCMPDDPRTPGDDPMCLDANGMEWAMAWMHHTVPPAGKVGFGYMLKGGSDANNNDPFATAPAAGQKWIDTGPHIMILNAGAMTAGYPRTAENTKIPYVMWPGTPYEHLMIPVR